MGRERKDLTQGRMKELFWYDHENGEFIRNITTNKNNKAGSIAGKIQKNGEIWISVDGFGYPAQRLAWLYVEGRLPKGKLIFKNRNKQDLKWNNIRHIWRSKKIWL